MVRVRLKIGLGSGIGLGIGLVLGLGLALGPQSTVGPPLIFMIRKCKLWTRESLVAVVGQYGLWWSVVTSVKRS